MAEQPFLIFPQPVIGNRRSLTGGGGKLRLPTAEEQRARLDAKFRQIAQSLQQVQTTVQGIEPEQVLVFETIGETLHDLVKAAENVPGLEWLAEMDLDDIESADGFADEKDPAKSLSRRLYAVMTNQHAMQSLLRLWDQWCADPSARASRGFGPYKAIFAHLKDLRRWSVEDRLAESRVVEYWQENLALRTEPVRFEVELWFRGRDARRNEAAANLRSLIQSAGGQCLQETVIEPILYHGILAELPAAEMLRTVDEIRRETYAEWLRCEDVMFFRPMAQAVFVAPSQDAEPTPLRRRIDDQPQPTGEPVVAVLDGLPLETHVALNGRLRIDDPDDLGGRYRPGQQLHGTAMASLVVHGDLNEEGAALPQPVYVRPIMVPTLDVNNQVREETPNDKLLCDLVHRCVLRLKEGDDAVGRDVRVVNLSIGNAFQPFVRELSPLARLLDWLAWKYKLLFIVSVGNQQQSVTLDVSPDEFRRLGDDDAIRTTIQAMRDEQAFRRQYSPAEAVNVLTVGATHADISTALPTDRRLDLLRGVRLPSPISTVSAGYQRSVKPEIFLPGGRQLYQEPLADRDGRWEYSISPGTYPPGQLVAAPGLRAMELDRTAHSRGSSNATALATRYAALAFERLTELLRDQPDVTLQNDTIAAALKAILVHAASWNSASELIDRLFPITATDRRQKMQERLQHSRFKARLLGFGEIQPERCLFCTDQRVTLLGWGHIGDGAGHVFNVPLPPSLSASRLKRRLTATLAWLTPINPRHRDYRSAYLWYDVPAEEFGVQKRDLDADTARRGTVEHRVFEGNAGRAFNDDLQVKVNCTANAGRLDEQVPYALTITLEIAEPSLLNIYEEVRDRVRPRVEIASTTE